MTLEQLQILMENLPEDAVQLPAQRLIDLGLDPSRLYQELEMSFPYVQTHRDSSLSNANMQLHSHAFYELLYCSSSGGAEYLVGSERYRLEQGDVIFVPPGISHRPLLPEGMTQPYTRYVLWLSQAFMEQFAALFPYPFTQNHADVGLLRTGEPGKGPVGELFLAGIREAEKRRDGWEPMIIGNTMTLLIYLKRITDAKSLRPLRAEKPELLDKLMAYVEANYGSPLTLGQVAKRFFVSESTVSHSCKEKLGVSFYRYVTQRRLIAAKTLIEKGELMENVALQTGFGDYSGFYRAFRQEYGITPRQYRDLQDSERLVK